MQTEKDKSILNHIVQHCESIFSTIGLRHVNVHGYGQLNTDIVWETLQEDVKNLYQYCRHLCEN